MREEVMVLPLTADGRKGSFSLSKAEEAAFNISKKWMAPEAKGMVATVAGPKGEDRREERGKGRMPAEKGQTEVFNGHERCTAYSQEAERSGNLRVLNREGMMMNVEGASSKETPQDAPLQWGNLKRSRGSRRGGGDWFALARETIRVQSASVTATMAPKGTSKPKYLVRKRDDPSSSQPAVASRHTGLEDGCKRVKTSRGPSLSKDVQKRVNLQGGRRSPAQTHQQDYLSHQSKTHVSPDKKKASLDRLATALNEAEHSIMDFYWPKFNLQLDWKEKEADFFVMKGGKIPQRPKRRSRALETTIERCTPGAGLLNITPSRYDPEEKKSIRRKPQNQKGLKGIKSVNSDSER